MSLKGRIRNDMKTALKAGERDRLKVIRLILAAVKQQEIDQRGELDDAAVLGVIDRMVRQRRDSVSQFRQGGRQDLVDAESAEIEILEDYLPEPLSQAELDAAIGEAIAETGAEGVRDIGKVMGRLKTKVQGRADMGAVATAVKSRLGR
ncbi:MAG TPA: GatB/YqeY domain-containing protein [Woeseiaceae bacterium]|nr:GatB/YqeY domain-containing protein [Woeseiaceae bacterium]